jgi:uncharacterized membrane protein YidH (DUF202 family)
MKSSCLFLNITNFQRNEETFYAVEKTSIAVFVFGADLYQYDKGRRPSKKVN